MNKDIYLDNSATTVVCDKAALKIMKLMTKKYGNPSSLHLKGLEAEREINYTKEKIADMIGANKEEIYFTSGGTEANNLAIFGTAKALKRRGNKIVTTAIEHSSVLESVNELEKQGFEVTKILPDKNGYISTEQLSQAIDEKTILVSLIYVNNEVGSVQPVEFAKKFINNVKSPALVHIDAVQAFGKIPIKVKKIGADLMSISGHKIHAPKGVGALYVSKKARILPLMFGGEQQKKLRPGTEPSELIAGLGAAIDDMPDISLEEEKILRIRDYAVDKLSVINGIKINSPLNALPYILNFSVDGIKSETLLHFLAQKNIYVSSGSACSKGKLSYVLKAMGLSKERIDSAIRISFSRYNKLSDIDFLIDGLIEAKKVLIRKR